MQAISTLDKVTAKIGSGRFPSFAEAHVIKALEEINQQKTIGRLKLSKDLRLGEGEVRTLVKHLKKEELIDVSKSGISLSKRGEKLLSTLRVFLSEQADVPSTPLTLGLFNIAVRVRGMKDYVTYGLEQRDAAIMAGAKGATTLIFTKNKLVMPGRGDDLSQSDPSILTSLSKLDLAEGDVVIIGSSDQKIEAELGAKTAALQLFKSKDKGHTKEKH